MTEPSVGLAVDPSLLPLGATTFERSMEAATALDARAPAIRPNARAKLDGFDPFVPWLIWEYGLGDILPYLSEPQRALREGIRWQRLRGTPEALRLAFSWRDLDGVQVFQEEPGQHFAAFQIDTNAVPPLEDIDDLIPLCRACHKRVEAVFHDVEAVDPPLPVTKLVLFCSIHARRTLTLHMLKSSAHADHRAAA